MLGLNITPAELIARIIVLVIAFTVHEFAHALVADSFGDDTPRSQGRLTLNPLVHLDPLGSLMLILVGFGWAKPVQINPYALQRRSAAAPMLVALAGPASNLLLAVLAAIPLRFGSIPVTASSGYIPSIFDLFNVFILINLLLMLFNLIPIFPLDGEKVLHYFLPPSGQSLMDKLRPYGSMILLALVFLLPRAGINVLETVVFQPALSIYLFLLG
ncbi:MAG: site-2 protease family protein [Chloroflexi bacterium]|nr:site-2 protease family protein [Chloroflexota bacterium]